MKQLYELGEAPPTGMVPDRMLAAVIRPERYGRPEEALVVEEVATPPVGPNQVLVWVMAAGVNYNVVWASLGRPVDVIALLRRQGNRDGYYIGGSDAAGIVWAIGDAVRDTGVGDEVILTAGQWDERAADIRLGADPTTSDSMRVWATRRATEGWPSSRSSTSTRPTPSLLDCPGRTQGASG